jgi:Spy/CpxP family protein refolding chaperone
MRPWIKPFVAGLFASAALLGGFAAWSEAGMPSPMAMHHGGGDPAAHEAMFRTMAIKHLDLDTAQTARLDTLIGKLHAQHTAMHGTGDLHAQLQPLIQGNAFDRAGAQTLLDTKLQQIRDGGPVVIAAVGDFYDGLRPDQQQKMRDFMTSHHEHGGMRMEMHESH